MVILSKKEYNEIVTERQELKKRIETLELSKDMMAKKINEYEKRIGLLELTPRERTSQSKVINEWINGAEEK